MNSTRTFSSADLALEDAGALAAAEYYGRLAWRAHSPFFFRPGRPLYVRWTVHRCWCSTSTVDSFGFTFCWSPVSHFSKYSVLVSPQNSKDSWFVLGLVFFPFLRGPVRTVSNKS